MRSFDRARDQRMRENLALLARPGDPSAGDALRAEESHEVIFERQEELRRTRIALTTGSSAQLAVDAA